MHLPFCGVQGLYFNIKIINILNIIYYYYFSRRYPVPNITKQDYAQIFNKPIEEIVLADETAEVCKNI